MHELDELEFSYESRLGNVISLLVPVRPYTMHCAWTQEVPLPAIEEFTCRLLVLLDEVLPGDIREYFGLSQRECEILVEGLVQNRLAMYTDSGHLAPSSILRNKSQGCPDVLPSLIRYEERVETPLFDLLTLNIIAPRKQRLYRFGLPHLNVPNEHKNIGQREVIEAFGQQYHAYLELQQRSEREIRKSRLYKISSCEAGDVDQVAIDVSISLESTPSGPIRVIKTAEDKANIRRPLTIEMEAKISDYLNGLSIPEHGVSFTAYCELVNDEVLVRHIQRGTLDFNAWLNARRENKTGYGTPLTQAMIGPIYLEKNRRMIESFIRDLARLWPEDATHTALWLASSVPLWAANGQLLSDFVYRIEPLLSASREGTGHICALLHRELRDNHSTFWSRIPNGIEFSGAPLEDCMEIFLIPGQLAVVQYHCQPSTDSAITVPIGYITVEGERLARIESLLKTRLSDRPAPKLRWPSKDRTLDQLFDMERFMDMEQARESHTPVIFFKPKRREY